MQCGLFDTRCLHYHFGPVQWTHASSSLHSSFWTAHALQLPFSSITKFFLCGKGYMVSVRGYYTGMHRCRNLLGNRGSLLCKEDAQKEETPRVEFRKCPDHYYYWLQCGCIFFGLFFFLFGGKQLVNPLKPSPLVSSYVGYARSLGKISYFPASVIRKIFLLLELCLGNFLAGRIVFAVVVLFLSQFKPLLNLFDLIPIYWIVTIFALNLTLEVVVDIIFDTSDAMNQPENSCLLLCRWFEVPCFALLKWHKTNNS